MASKLYTEAQLMSITMQAWDHSYSCRCEKCAIAWVSVGPDGGEPGNFGPFTEEEIRETAEAIGEEFPEGFTEEDEDEAAF